MVPDWWPERCMNVEWKIWEVGSVVSVWVCVVVGMMRRDGTGGGFGYVATVYIKGATLSDKSFIVFRHHFIHFLEKVKSSQTYSP